MTYILTKNAIYSLDKRRQYTKYCATSTLQLLKSRDEKNNFKERLINNGRKNY